MLKKNEKEEITTRHTPSISHENTNRQPQKNAAAGTRMTIEQQLKALGVQDSPHGDKSDRTDATTPAATEKKTLHKKTAPKREAPHTAKKVKASTVNNNTAKLQVSANGASSSPQKHKPVVKKQSRDMRKPSARIIPLGGLHEIGKNITAYECGNDMLIVDCGMGFPDSDMLGVDLVIPDFTFLEKNKKKLRGVVITHGHEDHIGSIPYLLKRINVPIYGTKLAIGLIRGKLKEHGLLKQANLNIIDPKQNIRLGCMSVEFIRVNHSIPDCVAVAIHTPAGVIMYTGDFKVDYSPIEGDIIDLPRFAELGRKGVLCLLSDSTNAERPGFTMSEKTVGQSFNTLFNQAEGKRILVATFSSNIHRIQQIVDCAVKYKRKVAVSGRSMVNVVSVATELGYLKIPKGVFIDVENVDQYPQEKLVIVTTGSQGEPLSALSRMSRSEHKNVNITSDDYIIISATPIPGNEKHVTNIVNGLTKLGAVVISEKMYEVHVSGHACQEELKLILALTKPKYFVPAHGEYKHLIAHGKLAQQVGIPAENILIADIGQVIQLDDKSIRVVDSVEAGGIFVDGIGVGDVGSIVIRDRQRLAQDGLIIVVASIEKKTGLCKSGPDIVSRGFVYVRESEQLLGAAQAVLKDALDKCVQGNIRDWTTIKSNLRDALSSFIYKNTKRSPMILPIIMEV